MSLGQIRAGRDEFRRAFTIQVRTYVHAPLMQRRFHTVPSPVGYASTTQPNFAIGSTVFFGISDFAWNDKHEVRRRYNRWSEIVRPAGASGIGRRRTVGGGSIRWHPNAVKPSFHRQSILPYDDTCNVAYRLVEARKCMVGPRCLEKQASSQEEPASDKVFVTYI